MEALISAAARMSGQPDTVVLEDFGVFLALPLMNMYKHLIPGDWKTLDVIEKTEETIHHVVRGANPRRETSCVKPCGGAKIRWC
jgi:hypothetical protein